MRQPDLCDGCLQPLDDTEGWVGADVFEPVDEFDEDEDPCDDSDYQYRFHSWGCVWSFAGRQVEEIPSIPLGDSD